MKTFPLIALTLLCFANAAYAHEDEFPASGLSGTAVGWINDGKPGSINNNRPRQAQNQTLPIVPARKIDFTTTEGTWMSVSVASDGQRMVFDMLGDIYALNTTGGMAKPLRTGMAFDSQPVFSPDGTQIAFISDASGADNLWVMQADGSKAHQVSFGEDDTVLLSPEWATDGQSLFLSRYRPSYNAYELWQYGLDGSENLIVPTKASGDQGRSAWASSLGVALSPDGQYLYMARHTGMTDADARDQWDIIRRDIKTGVEATIVAEPNGSGHARNPGAFFRPVLSPDGKYLAYATRSDNQTGLRLRDLTTGADKWLAYPVTHDQLQANAWLDLLPRYTFTPDSQAILISVGGKFERLALDGQATPIPFSADVHLQLGALSRQVIREDTGPVHARLIMAPSVSPDGKSVAFSALGQVYVMPLKDGGLKDKVGPRRIAEGWQPAWSPDGQSLTYVSWSVRDAGDVWTVKLKGGKPQKITTQSDYYTWPVFTPDGTHILAMRSRQDQRQRLYMEYGPVREAQLISLSLTGAQQNIGVPMSMGQRPGFTGEAGTVYLQTDAGLSRIDLKSGARTDVIEVDGPGWYFQDGPVSVDALRLSPDGKWILAQVAQQLHIVEMPKKTENGDGRKVIDLSDPKLKHRRITDSGADFFEWSADGKTIIYALGSTVYERRLDSIALSDKPDWTPDAKPSASYHADVVVPRDVPTGTLLLRGGRLLPMDGPAIEKGDILIIGNRIAKIGTRGSFDVPKDAVIRDVTGKTIMPGLIDTHDHIGTVRREVLDTEDWALRERLAYGVTTSFDPSTLSIDMLAYQDMLDAGLMTGPRLPSTGTALFSFNRFASLDDTKAVLRRYTDAWRIHNIKSYRAGDRRVRQWINMAALDLGLQPTTEGALSLKLDLTQIMDGYSGNEHALVALPLYNDVIQLMAQSRTSYTTTLQISNGGATGQDYFIARDNPAASPKYQHLTPHFALQQMTTRLDQWLPLSDYAFPTVAKGAADIKRAGGVVGIGAHGNTPGLGIHWEIEAHVMGGMTPEEAVNTATMGSAETIGRTSDIGSLTVGKFADLLILDADPRADIKNLWLIDTVMKNGRLYRSENLDQIWPDNKPALQPWFADQNPNGQN